MSIMHAVAAVGADAPTKVVQVGGVDSAGDLRPLTINTDGSSIVVGNSGVVAVTLSLDTSAYGAGDLLADTQEVANAMRVAAGTGGIHSIVLNDKDDQGAELYLVFLSANVSLGTENQAPSITDANADNILGIVPVYTSDWVDLGGCRVATLTNVGLVVKAATASTSLYIAAVNGAGTPTYTAAGITMRLGLWRD